MARALLELGYQLRHPQMDTALAAYILNPSQRTYDLAAIAERMLDVEVTSPDEEGTELGMLPFDEGPDLDAEGRNIEATRRLVRASRTGAGATWRIGAVSTLRASPRAGSRTHGAPRYWGGHRISDRAGR